MSDDPRCPECLGLRGLPRILHDQDTPRECANPFHGEEPPVVTAPEPQPGPVAVPDPPAPAPEIPKQSVAKPICPYCLTEGKIYGNMTTLGDFEVCVVRCGNNDCRKILFGFQALQLHMAPPPGAVH